MRPVSNTFNTTGAPAQHSPWHSPVPYLFGGLAAMLGLIAFALLILACSYWKLSGYLENGDNSEREAENSDEKPSDSLKIPPDMEARVVVIMAGDEKPTYLATPICSRASSFADKKENEKKETQKEGDENQETQNQNP
ncbi:protein GLUTAMINE DUMPER 3-like [Magnolia sinica]|uniref:protein GLUTAMINE DUMPER 3-like n=1 Tax=Magnolia sinica TaxID=86752 RepID=UPI00265AE980|nr:protein GLUTAMINE DUMPER 3-like [Magnolia sinica]